MKELIYIHASSSYIASHFFNAQQSYFTFEADKPVLVDPDVSFREGLAPDGSTTYCPRLILLDYKSRFGSLSHINALNINEEEVPLAVDSTWTGAITEHRQEPIPQSSYHVQLENGEDEQGIDSKDLGLDLEEGEMKMDEGEEREDHVADLTNTVRFWSDYSRVYYHPRGLHRVPDPAEWEHEVGWAQGVEKFALYDMDNAVLEDSFRLFAEGCDLPQGVQLCFDAPSFGSFTVSLLTQFRDEYPKLPLLSFCSLSGHDPAKVNLDDTLACVSALNDASTLDELASLSSITVPLQCPTTWRRGMWSEHLTADFTNPYHSAALLTTHIESATLPLRFKPSISDSTDLASFCAQLNWRGNTPFAALFGASPVPPSLSYLNKYCFDYSHPSALHKDEIAVPFAQRDIFRGLDAREKVVVQSWAEETQSELREPFLTRAYIDIPYPIPSSHPQFFTRLSATGRGILSPASTRVRSLPMYTSLRTTPRTGALTRSYARLVQSVCKRGARVVEEAGMERDALVEMEERLWLWDGAYGGEESGDNDMWGEDEGGS